MDTQAALQFICKLLSKENITFALSVFGSIGTLWTIIQSRKNLDFKLHYFGYSKERKLALAYIQFVNKSRIPISITDVCLKIDRVVYPCKKIPSIAGTVLHKCFGTQSVDNFYSVQLPIFLSALGGTSCYLVFDIPQEYDTPLSTPVKITVSSNRGRTLEVELQPDQVYFDKQ